MEPYFHWIFAALQGIASELGRRLVCWLLPPRIHAPTKPSNLSDDPEPNEEEPISLAESHLRDLWARLKYFHQSREDRDRESTY